MSETTRWGVTMTSDELLFGDQAPRSRDSDGDGVSDAQETLDGTDANDATSSIRHDGPIERPDTGDPRDDLEQTRLERNVIIDVAANTPSGMSLEQSLPTGLDGQPLPTTRHYGNADADKLMESRVDENSPLGMKRDLLDSGAQHGAGTRAGAPPPGVQLGTRAPNSDLVGAELPEYEKPDDGGGIIDWVKDLFTPEPSLPKQPVKEFVPPREPAPEHVPKPPQRGPKMGTVDPDAGGDGGGDIERAIILAGADTDFVRNSGAPQIADNTPLTRAGDLVTDPSPEAEHTAIDTTVLPTRPDDHFTDTVNPDSGFTPTLQPQHGPQPGGGDNTGGQEARQGQSYSATADDSSDEETPGFTSVRNSSASSGIQTVAAGDRDGDGVSDAQEAIDGTDPDDAADSIRHDQPVDGPTPAGPRGDLELITLVPDALTDVAAMNPTNNSLEQSLPKGLDGEAITTQRHYGNADADKLLGDQNMGVSPLGMERSPLDVGITPTPPGANADTHGGLFDAPPPGAELSFNARNMGLVSGTDGGTTETAEERYKRRSGFPEHESAEDKVKNRDSNKENLQREKWAKEHAPKGMTDPDGDSGVGGVVTEADVTHAVAVAGADTDFVRGQGGGPQIENDAPPASERDLVTHRNPDDDTTTFDTSGVAVVPPGGFVTDTVNPDSGFTPVLDGPHGAGGPPPQDPVAEAMWNVPDDVVGAPFESFAAPDVADSIAVPEEVDLDDGF